MPALGTAMQAAEGDLDEMESVALKPAGASPFAIVTALACALRPAMYVRDLTSASGPFVWHLPR